MLFLYVISLLFLTLLTNSHTLSESDAINKVISEILQRVEKKNAESIQFTWKNRIFIDDVTSTQYKEILNPESVFSTTEAFYEKTEPTVNKLTKHSSLRLQDIIVEYNKVYGKTGLRAFKEDEQTTKGHNNIKTRKASRSTRTLHNEMTTPMIQDYIQKNKIISKTVMYMMTNKPLHNDAIYVTKIGTKVRGRIFSEPLFDSTTSVSRNDTSVTTSTHHKQNPNTTTQKSITAAVTTVNDTDRADNIMVTPKGYEDDKIKNVYPDQEKSLEDVSDKTNPNSYYQNDQNKHSAELSTIIAETSKHATIIKDIEDLINSIPNYERDQVPNKYNSLNDLLRRLEKGVSPSTDVTATVPKPTKVVIPNTLTKHMSTLNKDALGLTRLLGIETYKNPVDSTMLEATQNQAMVTEKTTLSGVTQQLNSLTEEAVTTNEANSPVADIYLIVDPINKKLKGLITVDSYDTSSIDPQNKGKLNGLTSIINSNRKTTASPKSKTVKDLKLKLPDRVLTSDLIELYGKINAVHKDDKPEKLGQKLRKNINWDRVRKFFRHDRVCNCKCKANKTMCRVCAASDKVMRELTFEFNNLATYMDEHCTEIQTFFWMNPSAGRKLRDSVHRIDKSLHDYYKRVKGKCRGRTCKTFTTYLDKRHMKKKKIGKTNS